MKQWGLTDIRVTRTQFALSSAQTLAPIEALRLHHLIDKPAESSVTWYDLWDVVFLKLAMMTHRTMPRNFRGWYDVRIQWLFERP